jgi:hypothetical protein
MHVLATSEVDMTDSQPIHTLQARLEDARLEAIQRMSAMEDTGTVDALHELATIQTALMAVREEIEAHRVKLGGGSEQGLA